MNIDKRNPSRKQHETHAAMDGGFAALYKRMTDEDGNAVTILICDRCAWPTSVECEHVNNKWVDWDKALICQFCGAEGT
jgi:hypothetical protein